MFIEKRNGAKQEFNPSKIETAILKAFANEKTEIKESDLKAILAYITSNVKDGITVEEIQDLVELELMKHNYHKEAKSYILYRKSREEKREVIALFSNYLKDESLLAVLVEIQEEFSERPYHLGFLLAKFEAFYKERLTSIELEKTLIKATIELTSKDAPLWEMIASRLLSHLIHKQINAYCAEHQITNFYEKIKYLTDLNLYGSYLLETYSESEVLQLAEYLDDSRDYFLNHSGLELLADRYLIKDFNHNLIETPQEMFMGIAMHLALKEKDRIKHALKFYHLLSSLKITMATPTIANSRRPFHQMSSCFIDTVGDSLDSIYKSVDNFAKVSKHGGGMGLYFGKVRANGSSIRGVRGASGGVIRWIKLINDTAVAVDQLGVRQGASAVYLDVWHKDLPEFLQLRTNNGDDRMKAHDIFPGVCYPDIFWRLCENNLDANWYMMCPNDVYIVKGYHLEDYYGEEFEKRYFDCISDPNIDKRIMPVKEVVRLIIKSLVETGTPFTFNRDVVNKYNPNSHKGIIYCSNLCTEIAQNMSQIEIQKSYTKTVDGDLIVVEESKPGDFVVCNLASLTLGRINTNSDEELEDVITTTVRALDNVIDLNYYPLAYPEITNKKYRAIGLGTSGYHHMLANNNIQFESEEHLNYVDKLYEKINYYALKASLELAKEKGTYTYFKGSEYESGAYFKKRRYDSVSWQDLAKEIAVSGLRNAYLLAVAPTGSTSIIAGTTAGVDPVLKKYFLEEKKGSMITRVAPGLNNKTFWLYKDAHQIDQTYVVRAAGIRGRHIDQAQSLNIYITNDYSFSQILNLYTLANKLEVKTIYYVRSKSLDVEECESCSS